MHFYDEKILALFDPQRRIILSQYDDNNQFLCPIAFTLQKMVSAKYNYGIYGRVLLYRGHKSH